MMSIIFRALLIGFALVLLAPAAAQAQATTAYAGGSPITLSIPVTASVGGRCGFADGGAPAGSYNQDDFDRVGLAHDFPLTLSCSIPSRVAVVSQNGGLLAAGTADPGYAVTAPYSVTLNLVANDGSQATATCAASDLKVGSTCAFAGSASTSQGLRIGASSNRAGSYLNVRSSPYSGSAILVAGNYSDILTITISPAA